MPYILFVHDPFFRNVIIGVRDQFFFWGAHTFLVRFARISSSAEMLAERGGGGTRALFFPPRPKSVLYFSIGLGVHDNLATTKIPQVWPEFA